MKTLGAEEAERCLKRRGKVKMYNGSLFVWWCGQKKVDPTQ